MIEMIENTPPPFESSDDDDKTIVDVEEVALHYILSIF